MIALSLCSQNSDVVSMIDDLECVETVPPEKRGNLRRDVPLSLLTVQGYEGQNCCVSILASVALR